MWIFLAIAIVVVMSQQNAGASPTTKKTATQERMRPGPARTSGTTSSTTTTQQKSTESWWQSLLGNLVPSTKGGANSGGGGGGTDIGKLLSGQRATPPKEGAPRTSPDPKQTGTTIPVTSTPRYTFGVDEVEGVFARDTGIGFTDGGMRAEDISGAYTSYAGLDGQAEDDPKIDRYDTAPTVNDIGDPGLDL